uniref:Eukaryotic translation initiation factor 4E type 3-like n=1 Tax=Hirondellea gigas TaxID=1518452 RepID=A0A2P2I5W9_9CRUS
MAEAERTATCEAEAVTNKSIANIEHPLETSWTYWCDKSTRGATAEQFKDGLTKIQLISTVEGFWRVYKHIPKVEQLASGVTYHVMRGERQPMWEDEGNCNGGTWRFRVPKKDSARVWEEVLLAAIGEQFNDTLAAGDTVVGVSMSIRDRDDLLQVWNNDSRLAETVYEVMINKINGLFLDPPVNFLASFYKPNQTHQAYEGVRTNRGYRKPS